MGTSEGALTATEAPHQIETWLFAITIVEVWWGRSSAASPRGGQNVCAYCTSGLGRNVYLCCMSRRCLVGMERHGVEFVCPICGDWWSNGAVHHRTVDVRSDVVLQAVVLDQSLAACLTVDALATSSVFVANKMPLAIH